MYSGGFSTISALGEISTAPPNCNSRGAPPNCNSIFHTKKGKGYNEITIYQKK